MEKKISAVEWFYDKIKSHFEHDGDLLETLIFTYAIAKEKEKEQRKDAYVLGRKGGTIKDLTKPLNQIMVVLVMVAIQCTSVIVNNL